MNEETLRKAVEAQALEDGLSKEGLEFNAVLTLRIEYKGENNNETGHQHLTVHMLKSLFFTDILMIDHLCDFTSLINLDLSNNLIEKIEGLDCLTNLTWLGKTKLCISILLNLHMCTEKYYQCNHQ